MLQVTLQLRLKLLYQIRATSRVLDGFDAPQASGIGSVEYGIGTETLCVILAFVAPSRPRLDVDLPP